MSTILIKKHNKNGFNAAKKGDFATAEKEFTKAFNLNPLNQNLLFNFVKVLHLQKKYSEIVDFASRSSIEVRKAWDQSLLFLMGRSAIEVDNNNLAKELFEILYEKNPGQIDFALPLSQVLLKNGELRKSVEILNKSIQLNKQDPSLLTNLAIVKAELGEYKNAEEIYLKVIKLTSNQFLGYYNYSLFLYNQNRFQEALEAVEKAKNIVPYAPEAIEIEKKILNRTLSNDGISDPLSRIYAAIDEKDWTTAFNYLNKYNEKEKDANFIAAITYLPEKYQSKFGDLDQFNPNCLVKSSNFIDANNPIIEELVKSIKDESSLVWNRPDKPTKRGFQTHEILANKDAKISKLIGNKLLEISKNYFLEITHNDSNFKNINFKLSGWGVILLTEGKQEKHIHPDSLVSGVLYLKIPKVVADSSNDQGNLFFPANNSLSKVPAKGDIILFPSYLPHETKIFTSDEERICIAFNLIDGRK